MAWSGSSVFRDFVGDVLSGGLTGFTSLSADDIKVALYTETVTPDKDTADAAYGVFPWNANEVFSAGQWEEGGESLDTPAITTPSSGVVMFDATDLASGNAATLANVAGCLVYDGTTTGDRGVCFNDFGGNNSVTNGTFTIIWHSNGIFRFTLT